jgi:hypothetical protein
MHSTEITKHTAGDAFSGRHITTVTNLKQLPGNTGNIRLNYTGKPVEILKRK